MENTGIIQEFAEYLRNVKNRSELTVSSYLADIRQFCEILKVDDFASVTKKDIESKYIYALVECGNAPASRARKLSSVKSFFKWAMSNGVVSINPAEQIDAPKIPHREPNAMNIQEIEDVMAAVKSDATTEPVMFRDIAIIQLLFGTGIRRSELANIKLKDLDLNNSSLLVEGKGAKQRRVYYGDTTRAVLSEFVESHRKLMKKAAESEYLFCSRQGTQLSLAQINNVVRKHFEAAGLGGKGYTVHTARRTFASHAYRNTGDIFAVQKLLGHSNTQTTMRYVMAEEDMKRKAACSVNF